jgi:hypothetical protein
MKKCLLAVLLLFVIVVSGASYVSAQDSQRKNEGAKVEGRAGDTNFDVRIQGDKENRSRVPQPGDGERGTPGPQGPAGAPGPQGPSGPAGSSSGFLGMDSTVALFVGLGIFAIVVIAIVAASRNGSRQV